MADSRFSFRTASLSLITLVAIFAGGCADVIASSTDARRAGIKEYSDGQYVDAAGSLRNATKADPRDYKAYYWLGASYDAVKSYQQAMQSYRAGLDVMSVTIEGRADKAFRQNLLDGLAISIAKGGDLSFASETNGPSGKLSASDQKFLEAKVYRYLDDPDNALINYREAALLDPKDFYILREYGLYLERLRQTEQATVVLRHAYALNATDKDVNEALTRLGTVIGPSLKNDKDLVHTPVPQGPLPEVNLSKIWPGHSDSSNTPEPAGARVEPTGPSVPPQD